jgi:hypothetical protein
MFSPELAITMFVFIGLLIAIKEYLSQMDNLARQEKFEEELAVLASRAKEPKFSIRSGDLGE